MFATYIEKNSISAFARKMNRVAAQNARGVKRAVRTATTLVRDEVGKRVGQARRANRQDNPQRFRPKDPVRSQMGPRYLTQRRPLQMKTNGEEGQVRFKSYRASLRKRNGKLNETLIKFFATNGAQEDIFRKSLRIDISRVRTQWESATDRAEALSLKASGINYINLRLKTRPRLSQWAMRGDKGMQFIRHNVEVPAKVRRNLIAVPVLNKEQDRINNILLDGALAGWDGNA